MDNFICCKIVLLLENAENKQKEVDFLKSAQLSFSETILIAVISSIFLVDTFTYFAHS